MKFRLGLCSGVAVLLGSACSSPPQEAAPRAEALVASPFVVPEDAAVGIFWRNVGYGGPGTGQNALWYVTDDGTSTPRVAASKFLTDVADLDWRMEAATDMDSDGVADLVWRHNRPGGPSNDQNQIAIWYMNADGSIKQGVFTGLPHVPDGWQIAAAADLDGDSVTDFVWRNPESNQLAFWYLGPGATLKRSSFGPNVPAEWQLAAAVDVDRDGHVDFVWRNTANGQNAVWFLEGEDGTTVAGATYFDTVADLRWGIGGVFSSDRNGQPDILWHNKATGALALWHLNVDRRVVTLRSGVFFPDSPYLVGWTPTVYARPRRVPPPPSCAPVPGTYLVKLRVDTADVSAVSADLLARYTGPEARIFTSFDAIMKGFSMSGVNDAQAAAMGGDSRVVAMTSVVACLNADRGPTAATPSQATSIANWGPNWGLDRIDQRKLPLDRRAHQEGDDGAGAVVYVVDTGLLGSVGGEHDPEFGGRATNVTWIGVSSSEDTRGVDVPGYPSTDTPQLYLSTDAVPAPLRPCLGGWHGHIVSSIAGGKTLGVARKAAIVSVQSARGGYVLANGQCEQSSPITVQGAISTDSVLRAFEWILKDHTSGPRAGMPAVVNFSASLPLSRTGLTRDDAVPSAWARLWNAGLFMVHASGNEWGPYWEGLERTAMVVANSDSRDTPFNSNSGPLVDLFAPGTDLFAHRPGWSGTSFAAPHVAGYAAVVKGLYARNCGGDLPSNELKQRVLAQSTKDVVNFAGAGGNILPGTPNRLLYAGSCDPTGQNCGGPNPAGACGGAEPQECRGFGPFTCNERSCPSPAVLKGWGCTTGVDGCGSPSSTGSCQCVCE